MPIHNENSWTPPLPTRATRLPPLRSRGSCRGALTDTRRNRTLVYESRLKRNVALMLIARRDVVDIHDQPPAVLYVDVEGKPRQHTFDFLAVLADGRKIAIAVKPAEKVEHSRFDEKLALIAAQTPKSFADAAALWTDAHMSRSAVANAELLHSASRDIGLDDQADEAVRDIVRNSTGRWKIADIVSRSGLAGRAFRAVIRLIFLGELTLADEERDQRVDYESIVVATPLCEGAR